MTDPVAPRLHQVAAGVLQARPFNARRLDEASEHWAMSNWNTLVRLDAEVLHAHPDRARLAIVACGAALQQGDKQSARSHAALARQWGCDKAFVLSVLLASARCALGRASFAAGRLQQADEHFRRSLLQAPLQSEARRLAGSRAERVIADLGERKASVLRQRKAGLKTEEIRTPTWIGELVSRCLCAVDVHEAVDTVLETVVISPDHQVCFLMCLADRFRLRNDEMTAMHFLNTAREYAHGAQRKLKVTLAKQLVVAGHTAVATDMFVNDALDAAMSHPSDEPFVRTVATTYRATCEAAQARHEHGHELLLAYLKLRLSKLRPAQGDRKLSMVEIGTTRENVPGQGSTRKLAEFCKHHGIEFVTVDMDEHNARMARLTFKNLGVDFQALAMKGEDYLRHRQQPVDFVFLDAYDFDHGRHSELRQSRYLKFLGSRIDEQACHEMHLDCAQSLVRLLSPFGVLCLDDTWLDDGRWTAKGTLAMPYLLKSGFELIDARNRAALLQRASEGKEVPR